jgi:transcriptional regulator GlxA family with amidase domain
MNKVGIVAVPETAGSALYGMVDVLSATGSVWETLVRTETQGGVFDVRIVSPDHRPFSCGHRVPVRPDHAFGDDFRPDIVILPEIWLGPDESVAGRHPGLSEWVRARHVEGSWIYAACSGAVLLAETGLLDGCDATSHWGYEDLFRRSYPEVNFRPEPTLAFADPAGRIVTAGGTTSWHDLALHIISRHASPGEALRIAKVYLLKLHTEGQLPYRALQRGHPHSDAQVRACQASMEARFKEPDALPVAVARAEIPERTLKRRFKNATGTTPIDYLQNLRIEEAKRILEATRTPVEEIGIMVGYDDASFFRRLFKRKTGLTAGAYRRMFQAVPAGNTGDGFARNFQAPGSPQAESARMP